MMRAGDGSGWIPSRGLSPFLAVVVIGTPAVWVLLFVLTWVVLPVGESAGLPYLFMLVLYAAIAVVAPLLGLQKLRPRAIRVDPEGITTRPFFGPDLRIPWSAVDASLPQPDPWRFQAVVYRVPGTTQKRVMFLSRTQWDAVRIHPNAPMWQPHAPSAGSK